MTAGIVIPCLNEARTLGDLLAAIAAQSRPPDKVVVVDDGSTDGSAGVALAFAAAHPLLPLAVVDGPTRGVAAAVNAGIAVLSTEAIIRLDGHCRPRAEYVERTLQWLSDPGVGVAGGIWRISPSGSTMMARAIAIAAAHPMGAGGAAYRRQNVAQARDVDTVPFGGFRRDLWRALDGLNERLLANEDYEFNYRVRRMGLRVVLDPRIESTYFSRPSLGELSRQYRHYGYWKQRMLAVHPGSVRLRQLAPAVLMPLVLIAAFVGFLRPMAWAVPAVYASGVLAAAGYAVTAARAKTLFLAVACAFVTIHWSWCRGFWRGLFGFPPIGRGPS